MSCRENAQTSLFDRGSGGVLATGFVMSSTTWWFRQAISDDFKVRAACRRLEFKRRRVWNACDEDGCYLTYVTEYKCGKTVYLRGPDGAFLTKKRNEGKDGGYGGHGPYVRMYDPVHPVFPSDNFPTFTPEEYEVTGDDGTTWAVGSRGNDLAVMRQEILNNRILWPDEKAELLAWFDGGRKIPDRHSEGADRELHQRVDSYYCGLIMEGGAVTEEDIRSSGLPDETVENLVHNLRHCHGRGQLP
jgi:hypothetical protein